MSSQQVETPNLQHEIKEAMLNTDEIKEWLIKHEVQFTTALKAFAEKNNNLGFQEITSTKGWEEMFQGEQYIPEQWKKSTDSSRGEFTAAGLCAIASGVIEKVLLEKYGNNIEIKVISLITSDMDIDTDRDIEMRPVYPHHIVRFKVPGGEWYTVDSAYKQFQFKVKSHKLLLTPTKNEPKIYNYNEWFTRMQNKDPENAWKYLPQERGSGELDRIHRMEIREGKHERITEEDYNKLFRAFSD